MESSLFCYTEVVMILSIQTNSESADDLRRYDWLKKKVTETGLDVRLGDHKGNVAFFISAKYQV